MLEYYVIKFAAVFFATYWIYLILYIPVALYKKIYTFKKSELSTEENSNLKEGIVFALKRFPIITVGLAVLVHVSERYNILYRIEIYVFIAVIFLMISFALALGMFTAIYVNKAIDHIIK